MGSGPVYGREANCYGHGFVFYQGVGLWRGGYGQARAWSRVSVELSGLGGEGILLEILFEQHSLQGVGVVGLFGFGASMGL